MFCPECKCEYREGFTRCSTCDVDLVESLDGGDASDGGGNSAGEKPKKIWTGVDRSVLDSVCDALEAANIPYSDENLEPRLLYASMRDDTFEVWVRESDYEAAREVLRKHFGGDESGDADAAAVAGVESSLRGSAVPGVTGQGSAGFHGGPADEARSREKGEEGGESARVSEGDESAAGEVDEAFAIPAQDSVRGAAPDDVPGDYDLEGPTVEIWSGEQEGMAAILKSCLAENGITAEVAPAGKNRERLLVHAHNEARGREIVHEVVEAAPPELE